MAHVRANGLELKVSRYPNRMGGAGEGPVLVFIHGLTVDHAGLGFTLGMPLSVGAEVILYDLRGHGRSQFVTSGYRVADHVADLEALLDALDVVTPVHIVAGSFGGVIGVAEARQRPDRVASLTLIEGMIPHVGWSDVVSAMVSQAADELSQGYTAEQAMDASGISSPRKAMAMARRAERLFLETSLREDINDGWALDDDDLAGIRCPVLGVYGDQSHLFSLAGVLPHLFPAARVHTVLGANHLQVFLHVRTLKALITDFVATSHTPAGVSSNGKRPVVGDSAGTL